MAEDKKPAKADDKQADKDVKNPIKKEKAEIKKEAPKLRMQDIVRFLDTNLDGSKPVQAAIRSVPGIGPMFSNAVSRVSGLGAKKFTDMSENEMKRLEDIILHPEKHGIPLWMLNRRREPQTNIARHLTASQLDFTHKMDINEMKKARSYKGVRHSLGLPVRGQRTRSSFRTGTTVGVKRKKEAPATAGAAQPRKEGK